MATTFDITIYQGARYALRMDIEAENAEGVTIPYDLTGMGVRGQLRPTHDSATFFSFTGTIVDAATGKVKLTLTPAVTATLPEGTMVYDVEVYHLTDTAIVDRVVQGSVTVVPEVTR